MTPPRQLVVLIAGKRAGTLERDARGHLRFSYDETWRAAADAIPLSLSMPLTATQHEHRRVEPFFRGLLPDNEQVLTRWARRFQVSARNAFALLAHTGEDLPGAVQLLPPSRVDAYREAKIAWLSAKQIGERLRRLEEDPSAGRLDADEGQFSLAGAQPKTALLKWNGRWGIPSGRAPTTHILKPPTGTFDGHAENEHFCLTLLRRLGAAAARTEVQRFDGEVAIVVERYDRVMPVGAGRGPASIVRVHQEDLCQALGRPPELKYQATGGPGPREVVDLLRTVSSKPEEDIARFVDALIFNWLIAGTDAHARNYSVLLGAGGQVRLAPLYDVASALPYPEMNAERLKLAMKVGDKYRLRHIGPHEWAAACKLLRLNREEVFSRIAEMAAVLPEHVEAVRAETTRAGMKHAIIGRLSKALTARAAECARLFGS